MLSELNSGIFSRYLDLLLACVFSLAFYGFLRVSEFTSPTSFDPARDITFSDVKLYVNHYALSLNHSKTAGACSIVIARTNSTFCPYSAMVKYLNLRPTSNPSAPLFLTPTHQHMTKAWFIKHLRLTLSRCGLPIENLLLLSPLPPPNLLSLP